VDRAAASPQTDRVGFIGLGIMGSRMAASLRRAGFELTVWNRTAEKARAWAEEHGAELATSPAELAGRCDFVITMVVDGPQVEAVLLGPDGVASGARPGLLCVDMSTIAPETTRGVGAKLEEAGVGFVDAPVTGSSPKAEDGTLTIMAGGEEADVKRAWPLFEAMGKLIVHVGPLGQGETLKLIGNAVAAANAVTVAQALLLARATEVDLDALTEVLSAGSGGSTMLDLKAKPMREHDYTTLFKLDHMIKDVTLCLEQSHATGVPCPSVEVAAEVLAGAADRGYGEEDFAAVIEEIEARAGRRL
jgi:3-hydroxyisobutyrate dehydrogenase-like beta-hydroxyacid dehydrogenase